MVEHGGDVNHQNRDGKTPQDIASGPCIQQMVTLGWLFRPNINNNSYKRYD